MQLGVHDGTVAHPLIAVRFWSSLAGYLIGDHVVSGGQLYRCIAAHTNSPPPSVNWALAGGVASFNTRTGAVVLTLADVTAVLPPSAVPPFMNGVAAPGTLNTFSRGDHIHPTDTSKYDASNPAGYITIASVPLAATTFPLMSGVVAIGTGTTWARADHVHPSDTSRLALTGGTMSGQIITLTPVVAGDAANKGYVDSVVAAMSSFRGTYTVATNTPNLTVTAGNQAGYYWTAVTAVPTVPEATIIALPGLPLGTMLGNGDQLIWEAGAGIYIRLASAQLTLAAADARYLQLAGGTLTGPLLLAADPAAPLEAMTLQYAENMPIDAGVF